MKKNVKLLIIVCISLLAIGCGKKEPSQVSCVYKQGEDNMAVEVEMLFKRDNNKKLVTSGKLIMTYDLSGITFGEESGENIGKDDIEGVFETMFSNVCTDIGDNYSDCEVVETKNGANIIMTFNLDNLAKTSAGEFHKNMTIPQIKEFITGKNKDIQMNCTTS